MSTNEKKESVSFHISDHSFQALEEQGLFSPRGVYLENLSLLMHHFPFLKDEVLVSAVGVYTLTLVLTTKRLIGMMGSRLENLIFLTIEFDDIDPGSIQTKDASVRFRAKGHTFTVPNNRKMNFDELLAQFISDDG